VSSNLIQIVATLTKLGWTTGEEHKQIVAEVSKFLHATTGHLVLGLQLLQQCVHRRPPHAFTRLG
jgi:exportin-7